MSAIDKIRETYIEEGKLASFLGITPARIRDMRSNHKTGKTPFIPYISPTTKCHLYHVDDVMEYLQRNPKQIFKNKEES